MALVPALFVGLLHLVFDDETTNDLFPMVLVALAVPLGLVAFSRTRRFGAYMLIGVVVTALVVGGAAVARALGDGAARPLRFGTRCPRLGPRAARYST